LRGVLSNRTTKEYDCGQSKFRNLVGEFFSGKNLSGDKISIDAFAVFTLFQKKLCARLTSAQKKNERLEICILKQVLLKY
jgi:transposase